MPATFAHPIAVLPLSRRPLVFSALVVGSLAPDFEYLLRLAPRSTVGHTVLGLFTFCLPLGLAVVWFWHAFLKVPLLELLPDRHYRALLPLSHPFSLTPALRFGVVALSVLLGAATHVGWDAFTHSNGWAVLEFPLLSTPVLHTPFGTLRMFKLLQHGSTLLGSLGLIAFYFRWLGRQGGSSLARTSSLSASLRSWAICLFLLVAGAVGLGLAWAVTPPARGLDATRVLLVRGMLFGGATLLLQVLLFAGWWNSTSSSRKVRGISRA